MTKHACVRASIAMFKVVSASEPSVWTDSKDQDAMFLVGYLSFKVLLFWGIFIILNNIIYRIFIT